MNVQIVGLSSYEYRGRIKVSFGSADEHKLNWRELELCLCLQHCKMGSLHRS
jgi:hypothetical protein